MSKSVDPENCNELPEFLKTSQEYNNLVKQRALIPEEMWESYKLNNVQNLAEQKLFKAACVAMKEAFTRRFIPEKSDVKSESSTSQSE